jgi:hypothetical protein
MKSSQTISRDVRRWMLVGDFSGPQPRQLDCPIFDNMNQLLSVLRATRAPATSATPPSTDTLLAELLALHEEMVDQLRAEHPHGSTTTAFLQGMIEQHTNAAAMLRAKLEHEEVTLFHAAASMKRTSE